MMRVCKEEILVSFSYNGEHLSFLIPAIYALNSPGTDVYIISPWIYSGVQLIYPWKSGDQKTTLMELCISEMKRGVDTKIFTSDMASKDPTTNQSIENFKAHGFEIKQIPKLHSKAIIGEYLKYQGSANITYSGIYKNTETVNILPLYKLQQEEVRSFLA